MFLAPVRGLDAIHVIAFGLCGGALGWLAVLSRGEAEEALIIASPAVEGRKGPGDQRSDRGGRSPEPPSQPPQL